MEFSACSVSTQTFTVKSNIQYIDLAKFFVSVNPITTEEQFQTQVQEYNNKGIMIQIKYQNLKKGYSVASLTRQRKKKRNANVTSKKNFLNCITMIIFANKLINIKFFKNGVLQLTGCKNIEHVIICIDTIWQELNKAHHCFTFQENALHQNEFVVYIKCAMRNIDFDIGYKINRFLFFKKIVEVCQNNNNVVVPDAVGNKMDIKIKLRLQREEIENLPITKITFPAKEITTLKYKTCIDIIEQDKKKSLDRFNNKFVSIFVFQNGKILLSAPDETVQEKYFHWFNELLCSIENDIKPNLLQSRNTFLVKNAHLCENIKA